MSQGNAKLFRQLDEREETMENRRMLIKRNGWAVK